MEFFEQMSSKIDQKIDLIQTALSLNKFDNGLKQTKTFSIAHVLYIFQSNFLNQTCSGTKHMLKLDQLGDLEIDG